MAHAIDRTGFGKQALLELLERPIAALGYELVDLEARVGRNGLLRIYIDRDGGVGLDDCELVSRQLSALLDVEDPMPCSYALEVSSPGLDRRLRTIEHFERFVGSEVRVELDRPQDGRRRFRGILRGVEDAVALVEVDGRVWRLALSNMAHARLVPQVQDGKG